MIGQHVGYIRVSSAGQHTERQLEGLELDKIFTEKVSGKDRNRPQLKACLDYVRAGDTLHIHSLDRLGRSLQDLENIVSELVDKGVKVEFKKENMEFSQEKNGSMGRLLFQILGAFAEFERSMIRERQAEGIAKAKAQGKHLGRKKKLTKEQKDEVAKLYTSNVPITQIASRFKVSRGTIYNVLDEYGIARKVSLPADQGDRASMTPSHNTMSLTVANT